MHQSLTADVQRACKLTRPCPLLDRVKLVLPLPSHILAATATLLVLVTASSALAAEAERPIYAIGKVMEVDRIYCYDEQSAIAYAQAEEESIRLKESWDAWIDRYFPIFFGPKATCLVNPYEQVTVEVLEIVYKWEARYYDPSSPVLKTAPYSIVKVMDVERKELLWLITAGATDEIGKII